MQQKQTETYNTVHSTKFIFYKYLLLNSLIILNDSRQSHLIRSLLLYPNQIGQFFPIQLIGEVVRYLWLICRQ